MNHEERAREILLRHTGKYGDEFAAAIVQDIAAALVAVATEARARALEEAAMLAERTGDVWSAVPRDKKKPDHVAYACREIADSIRALKEEPPRE